MRTPLMMSIRKRSWHDSLEPHRSSQFHPRSIPIMWDHPSTCKPPSLPMLSDPLPNLAPFGYPYTQNSTEGFLTWPPSRDFENSYTYSFVTSVEECAVMCQDENAPFGSWYQDHDVCNCIFVVDGICNEPCLEEAGIGFSSIPLANFEHCEKSHCDNGWYYDRYPVFCRDVHGFDQALCDVKIEEISELKVASFLEAE